MPREVSLRCVAWSGAAFGALLIFVGWLSIPSVGSNYAEVLADQAGRIEAGMWAAAGVGVGIPAVIWLLSVARRTPERPWVRRASGRPQS
jgi:hypothetical protein